MYRRSRRLQKSPRISRILTAVLAATALSLSVLVPATTASATPVNGPAKASLVGFSAGNIISDAVFTSESTMTEAQIQSFFNSKVKTCQSGYTCLKDFRITSVSRPADTYCKGYTGAANESAARIIYRVSQSCNINPQVLIVMLQKEQGLVTHTWPSQWRYDKALGQACPDTAPCDPKFVGFFHQVYGAARQMQIYMEGRYFTWYAPGKTWNILYNPNTACGSSPVYIANKATAALYYYTPYQPNAAALRAGYGTGDSCSAYGNRNFYNYFTDWFGSTQTPAGAARGLVKVGADVWLLSGANRYHVTAAAYPEYKRVFGTPVTSDSSTLARFAEGALGGLYVKNAATGEVAMLQDGQTHRFVSCGLVGVWGGACGAALVVLTGQDFDKFATGAEMSLFGRLSAGGRVHQIDGTRIIPLYDAEVAKQRNGGAAPYAAVLPAAAMVGKSIDPSVRFLPATFVKSSTASEVWLPDEDGALHHLPSWPLAAEVGLPGQVGTVAPAADLTGYKKSTPLAAFVRCGGIDYAAAGGKLSRMSSPVPTGFVATALTDTTCAHLDLSGPAIQGKAVFVQFAGTPEIYVLSGGQYRPVPSAAQRTELNGGTAPTVLVAGTAYKSRVVIGSLYPASATFIRVNGTPEVWLVDGSSLIHLPSWAMAAEYGLPTKEVVVDSSAVSGMTKKPSLTQFAACSGSTYVAAGGKLRAVSAGRTGGAPVTSLSAAVCAGRTTGTAVDAPVFVGDGVRTSVAVGKGWVALPDAAAVNRAAAGAPVVVHRVSTAYLPTLPAGSVPGEGALVRSSRESAVTMINGSVRMHLPNWGVAADLGVQARYQVVAPEAIASRPIGGPAVSIFVTCGATTYVGSGGQLVPISSTALGGFAPVKLTDAACKTLSFRAGAPLASVRFSAPTGEVYSPSGGKLVRVQPDPAKPALPLDARTIASLPKA
ncbi:MULTISPECIES: hypothetical protein [unclassified Microbacterium]|uniref:hypothetical protein n=1 Tax=unclassified Microbacterium TaxID=2609290 RepID=UPI0018DF4AE4|nr:hypothetical protein [Microbacterium sp. MAH-37]